MYTELAAEAILQVIASKEREVEALREEIKILRIARELVEVHAMAAGNVPSERDAALAASAVAEDAAMQDAGIPAETSDEERHELAMAAAANALGLKVVPAPRTSNGRTSNASAKGAATPAVNWP